MKPLNAWVVDLVYRIDTIRTWIEKGTPAVFWISGFYFPQVKKETLPVENTRLSNLSCGRPPTRPVVVRGRPGYIPGVFYMVNDIATGV